MDAATRRAIAMVPQFANAIAMNAVIRKKAIAMIPGDSRERSHGCHDSQSDRDGTAIHECNRDECRNSRRVIAMIPDDLREQSHGCRDSQSYCDGTAIRKCDCEECRDSQKAIAMMPGDSQERSHG